MTHLEHTAVLYTAKLAEDTSQFYFVLYKACARHFPVLLCTTKLEQKTSQYTPHFTLHTSHFKLHTSRFTLHTPLSSLHAPHFPHHFTIRTPHSTLPTSLPIPHFTLHTSHITHHTLHSTLLTPHFPLHSFTRHKTSPFLAFSIDNFCLSATKSFACHAKCIVTRHETSPFLTLSTDSGDKSIRESRANFSLSATKSTLATRNALSHVTKHHLFSLF